MATHPIFKLGESAWTVEPGGLQYSPWGHKVSDTTERLNMFLYVHSVMGP